MIRFRKLLPLAAAVAVAVALGAPRPAHAYIEIDYSIDNGGRTFGASSNTGFVTFSGSGLGGFFDVLFTIGTTNTPGGQQALITQSNNSVSTDYTDVNTSHTLHIYVSSTGFTQPQSPPPTSLGNASSITENGGSTTVVFSSYADATNTLFGTSGSSTSVTYSVSGQAGKGDQSSTLFSPNGATYSLTNIGDFTMTGGTSLTVVSGNTTVTPTPAPAGAVLALAGLPVLGIGGWLRRRKQA
jgi:MYXO-CTERM domain-containing protein